MGLALIAFFLIVDFPHKNKFLTTEQTAYVQARIEADRGDAVPDALTLSKGISHALDWKAWTSGLLFGSATLPAYAFACAFSLPSPVHSSPFQRLT